LFRWYVAFETLTATAWSIIPAIWNGGAGARGLAGPQWRQQCRLLAQGRLRRARECHVLYLHPARLDDVLGITTEITDWKGALAVCNGLPWMIGNASVSRSPWPASTARAVRRGYRLVCKKSCQDRPLMDPVTTTAAVNTAAHSLSPSPFSCMPNSGRVVMPALLGLVPWSSSTRSFCCESSKLEFRLKATPNEEAMLNGQC